jgi:tetratricopeptide (TPR) repeat protein
VSDDEVRAVIAKAYACDREGDERAAVRYYDAAWELGVPDDVKQQFLVGYGSTLRNVGRADDAVAILGEAVAEFPDYPALQVFLALALHSAGHPAAGLAAMLAVVLDLNAAAAAGEGRGPLDGYQRALGDYHRELLDAAIATRRG